MMHYLEISALVVLGFVLGNLAARLDMSKYYSEKIDQIVFEKMKYERYLQKIYFYALIGLARNCTEDDEKYEDIVNTCVKSAKEVVDEESKVCQTMQKNTVGEKKQ